MAFDQYEDVSKWYLTVKRTFLSGIFLLTTSLTKIWFSGRWLLNYIVFNGKILLTLN